MTSKWGDDEDEKTGDRTTGIGKALTVDEAKAVTGALNGIQALFEEGGSTTSR